MAESGQPSDKIACQLLVIELVKVIHPQVLKMTIALKHVIADHEQGMAGVTTILTTGNLPLGQDKRIERQHVRPGPNGMLSDAAVSA